MKENSSHALSAAYPEIGAGGFSRVDGTVQFYSRVNALAQPSAVILDFGAGRGEALMDDTVAYRRDLRSFKAKVARVIGVDPDPAVETNPGLDENHVVPVGQTLPLADASVDIIVADYVFEHIGDPAHVAAELTRVLRPGGWLCARTPTRWSLVSLAARLIPNSWHRQIVRRAQPGRKAEDVFPTAFRMNTRRALRRLFPESSFSHHSYVYVAEPAYFGRSTIVFRILKSLNRIAPWLVAPNLFVFLEKRDP